MVTVMESQANSKRPDCHSCPVSIPDNNNHNNIVIKLKNPFHVHHFTCIVYI